MPRPFEKVTENRADNIYHGPKIRIEMLVEIKVNKTKNNVLRIRITLSSAPDAITARIRIHIKV